MAKKYPSLNHIFSMNGIKFSELPEGREKDIIELLTSKLVLHGIDKKIWEGLKHPVSFDFNENDPNIGYVHIKASPEFSQSLIDEITVAYTCVRDIYDQQRG